MGNQGGKALKWLPAHSILRNAYEYLYTGQTQGIDVEMKSNITGFITIPDNELNPINSPNGKVTFVEFI